MANPDAKTVTSSTVDMETDICCHGCTAEWKIYDFENRNFLISKNIEPPGCDYSWQLTIAPSGKLMTVGFQLTDKRVTELPFFVVVDITLQNTSGDVFRNEKVVKPSFPHTFMIGRPSSNRSLLIIDTGEQFQLARDGVLVVKAVIVTRGCCIKNKEVSLVSEKD